MSLLVAASALPRQAADAHLACVRGSDLKLGVSPAADGRPTCRLRYIHALDLSEGKGAIVGCDELDLDDYGTRSSARNVR